jgi:hypothetical protein
MSFEIPNLPHIEPIMPSGHITAVWSHLQREYRETLEKASSNEDIAVTVVLFGGREIAVSEFGYAGPNLLVVYGKLNGKEVTVYVHQSSLQVIFEKLPKDESAARQPMGFRQESEAPTETDEPADH